MLEIKAPRRRKGAPAPLPRFRMADLFCGAGGTSTGGIQAAKERGYDVQVLAVNHWEVATATFRANHADQPAPLLTGVDSVKPSDHYRPGELDLLWASPECTHHSNARGGKPMNEQSRATAWCVLRWAAELQPACIMVENVPEFVTWGGLCRDGRPIKAQRGKTFQAWVMALESLGYQVQYKKLRAADYGDPTTRLRLFVYCVRRPFKVIWPEPTHARRAKEETREFFERDIKPWRSARDHVIDWSLKGPLLTERERPLAQKTMDRILAGFFKQLDEKGIAYVWEPYLVPNFGERPTQAPRTHSVDEPLPAVTSHGGGCLVEPVLVQYQGDHQGREDGAQRTPSVDEPLPTVTTENRFGLAEPMLIPQNSSNAPRSVDDPVPTLTTTSRGVGLAEPFQVEFRGTAPRHIADSCRSIEEPVGTITAGGIHTGLVEPMVMAIDQQGREAVPKPVQEPVTTITTKARHALVEPEAFLVQVTHGNGRCGDKGNGRRAKSIDEPLPTVCGTRGDMALVEPSVLPQHSGGVLRPVSEPLPTVATAGAIALVEPEQYLVKFYGTATAQGVDEPLHTVRSKDCFALVETIPATGKTKAVGGLMLPLITFADGRRILVDFRFRMLQPHELAAAQGFPAGYHFSGTKTHQVMQIGNAVPCGLARALVDSFLAQRAKVGALSDRQP